MLSAPGDVSGRLVDPIARNNARLAAISRTAIFGSGLFFLGLLLAGTVVRVPAAVLAQGTLRIADTAIITHATGGTIEAVAIKEGQIVNAGQTLITLASVASASQSATARLNRDELLARRARIESELAGRSDLQVSADEGSSQFRKAIERERLTLRSSLRERSSQRSYIREEIALREGTLGDLDHQLEANLAQARLIDDELAGLRDLFARGLVTKTRLNALERTAIQLDAATAALRSARSQTQADVAALKRDLVTFDSSQRETAQGELLNVERDLAEQTNRLTTSREQQDGSRIKAPIDGRVNQVVFNTKGSAVPAGATLVTIVPVGGKRHVTAFVRPSDVDLVATSQEVRIVLGTAGRTSRSEVTGIIDFVAEEGVTDPVSGREQFEVSILLKKDAIKQVASLRSGTPVEVFFVSESRPLLAYLIRPILDQIERAMLR